jgi:hypothetical protein
VLLHEARRPAARLTCNVGQKTMAKNWKLHDKPAALDHALYEIEMLTHALLALNRLGVATTADGSGWLEVFAVHARNLNEFFAKEEERGVYMKPHHFVMWTYSYTFDSSLARRASSQVAHLTYDRERPEEKTSWPFAEHFRSLREQVLPFLQAVEKVDSQMAYQSNRARTQALLNLLPRIRFV